MERFYLIVGHVSQIELLVPHGVRLVQLRLKGLPETEVRRQITRARDFCAVHRARLVVNGHWKLALDLNCRYVHLGQESIDSTDFPALRRAGIEFGLSTHDELELERALSFDPAYIALGPIHLTLLKKKAAGLQGLAQITRWKKKIGQMPLVAIGGITPERLPGVFDAGADSVAVLTDIQCAQDPEAQTCKWLQATAVR
ncbi:thiamine-phosphate pyrophosphorylase [Marinosulfonomonas sp. PRT-SC04]|nr:thiamine-phosphate pyrophosphorylase [Marinosulfonomonas sp. PRT-SC04]